MGEDSYLMLPSREEAEVQPSEMLDLGVGEQTRGGGGRAGERRRWRRRRAGGGQRRGSARGEAAPGERRLGEGLDLGVGFQRQARGIFYIPAL